MTEVQQHTFTLPPAVTIDNVESLAKELLALNIASGGILTLDASQTEVMTTPGVQLLIALDKSLANSCAKLIVSQPKDALITVFKSLGLENQLSKWSA